jgi:hypothetical protein
MNRIIFALRSRMQRPEVGDRRLRCNCSIVAQFFGAVVSALRPIAIFPSAQPVY